MEGGQFTLKEYREALQRFRVLLEKAKGLDLKEPTAMILVVPVYSVRLGNIELAPIPGQHGPACF